MSLMNTIAMACALSAACAVLSVIVVLRRWAFIGEGISHSGFGGAGTAWLITLLLPSLDQPAFTYAAVVVFCLATSVAIGAISRGKSVHADAAIGIFMTASLAWGMLGQQVYARVRGSWPTLFENLLFGQFLGFSPRFTLAAVVICLMVVLIVAVLWKQIMSYTFDPMLAATSGVPVAFIHYLLMVLLALVIVIGARVAGTVLVTALLVLPGATALLLSARIGNVVGLSIAFGLIGCASGLVTNAQWHHLPAGPVMVLVLFLEFVVAHAARRYVRGQP